MKVKLIILLAVVASAISCGVDNSSYKRQRLADSSLDGFLVKPDHKRIREASDSDLLESIKVSIPLSYRFYESAALYERRGNLETAGEEIVKAFMFLEVAAHSMDEYNRRNELFMTKADLEELARNLEVMRRDYGKLLRKINR